MLPLKVRGLPYGHTFLELVHGGAFFSRPSFAVRAEHDGEELDFTATEPGRTPRDASAND
jgi:hypothetical protein